MAAHSNILACKISWTEEPDRLTVHGVTKSRTWLNSFHFLFPKERPWYTTIVFLPIFLETLFSYYPTFQVAQQVKEFACQCRRHRLDPWVGRIHGEENGNPLQYSCLENLWTEGPGGLQSMESQRVRHKWATEDTHMYMYIIHTFDSPYSPYK